MVAENDPAIGRIRWRPNGNLWVEPIGVELEGDAMACFDEFGPDGEYLRRLTIEMADRDATDRFLILEDGRFVVLRGFDADEEDEETSEGNGRVILLESANPAFVD